jgi:hypothetical protein
LSARLEVVDDWLAFCKDAEADEHSSCGEIRLTGFPSRLLDLSGAESTGYIRLVETQGWSEPLPVYTTLSHCWGDPNGPRPKQTTLATYQAHKARLSLKGLPKTFRDAITITIHLGITLIWIDSLTIIQDNREDWKREAAKMAAVYENAFLTIAATSAHNCEDGLYIEPYENCVTEGKFRSEVISPDHPQDDQESRPRPEQGAEGFEEYVKSLPEDDYIIKLKRSRTPWRRNQTDSARSMRTTRGWPPLHKRGWVFQEATLSRRILHMANGHMIWACREMLDQEDVDIRLHDNGRFSGLPSFGFTHGFDLPWWEEAQKFSMLSFTHTSDRLPAIAGLIQHYASGEEGHTIPLLGIWGDNIAYQLSWHRDADFEAKRMPSVPSTWTWLSTSAPFEAPDGWEVPRDSRRDYTSLSSWTIEWESEPYVSSLLKGTISLHTKITRKEALDNSYHEDDVQDILFDAAKPYCRDAEFYWPDLIEDVTITRATGLRYMLLYGSSGMSSIVYLAIMPAPNDPTMYIRLGTGSAHFEWPLNTKGRKIPAWIDPDASPEENSMWEDAKITLC